MRLRQRLGRLVQVALSLRLGGRSVVAGLLHADIGLLHRGLRRTQLVRRRVFERVELRLGRAKLCLRAGDVGGGGTAAPGFLQVRLGTGDAGFCGGEILRRGIAFLRLGQLGLGACQLGLRVRHLRLQIAVVEACQHLAFLDGVARVDQHLRDAALCLKVEIERADRRNRAGASDLRGDGAALYRCRAHGGRG